MNFPDAVKTCFNKYATVSGRAVRSEYWFWALFCFIATIVLGVVDGMVFGLVDPVTQQAKGSGPLGLIFMVVTLVPYICVGVRRMHDINKSGWWLLISLIPILGWILFIIWAATPGTPGDNRFGPAPVLSA